MSGTLSNEYQREYRRKRKESGVLPPQWGGDDRITSKHKRIWPDPVEIAPVLSTWRLMIELTALAIAFWTGMLFGYILCRLR